MYVSAFAPGDRAAELCCVCYGTSYRALGRKAGARIRLGLCFPQKWQQKSTALPLNKGPHFYFTFSRHIKVLPPSFLQSA